MRPVSGATLFLSAALALSGAAADGPNPPFKLPVAPAQPAVPTPMPPEVSELAEGQLFVITRDAEFRVFDAPRGLVTVRVKKLKPGQTYSVYGKFAGGKGGYEEREYVGAEKTGTQIAVVEPRRSGDAELILAPRGDEDWEVRLSLSVKMGDAPRPPPDPPKPDPTPKAEHIAVVVVAETRDQTPAQGKLLLDKSVRDWLKAGGHTLDVVEKDDPAAAKNGFLPYASRAGLPAVLVFDAEVTGQQVPLKTFKLPETAAAWKSQLEGCVRR